MKGLTMEDKIRFLSDGHEIEGRLEKSNLQKGVVITHPHPLYGGDMHNIVVIALTQVYHQNGYTSLRFNFLFDQTVSLHPAAALM